MIFFLAYVIRGSYHITNTLYQKLPQIRQNTTGSLFKRRMWTSVKYWSWKLCVLLFYNKVTKSVQQVWVRFRCWTSTVWHFRAYERTTTTTNGKYWLAIVIADFNRIFFPAETHNSSPLLKTIKKSDTPSGPWVRPKIYSNVVEMDLTNPVSSPYRRKEQASI